MFLFVLEKEKKREIKSSEPTMPLTDDSSQSTQYIIQQTKRNFFA